MKRENYNDRQKLYLDSFSSFDVSIEDRKKIASELTEEDMRQLMLDSCEVWGNYEMLEED